MPKKSMSHPLYLTADEQKLFAKLPEELKEGWEVREEKGGYEDSSEREAVRYELLRLSQSKYKSIVNKANAVRTESEFRKFVAEADLTSMSQDEIIDILFTLGPRIVSALIAQGVSSANQDKDIDLVSAFTNFRHLVLKSYASATR